MNVGKQTYTCFEYEIYGHTNFTFSFEYTYVQGQLALLTCNSLGHDVLHLAACRHHTSAHVVQNENLRETGGEREGGRREGGREEGRREGGTNNTVSNILINVQKPFECVSSRKH